jgi:hypothetical protein
MLMRVIRDDKLHGIQLRISCAMKKAEIQHREEERRIVAGVSKAAWRFRI